MQIPDEGDFADNLSLYEEMYQRWQSDPHSVPESWDHLFTSVDKTPVEFFQKSSKVALTGVLEPPQEKSVVYYPKLNLSLEPDLRIFKLIDAYRTYGYLECHLDPLSSERPAEPPELSLENLGFSRQDLSMSYPACGILDVESAPLLDIINALKSIYCAKIGFEYMGLQNVQMENWLQDRLESQKTRVELTMDQKRVVLQQLNQSELFESFVHTKYPGQKRFSLEGAESLIPVLSAILDKGSSLGMEEVFIGMAHRGRLNVLCNILDKSYTEIFSEFEENYMASSFEGSGDVKYHKGFASVIKLSNGKTMKISLPPNPSHLESVDPVIEGEVYAKQKLIRDDKKERAIPILIHGDAALAGQGVVYETMQLSKVPGYSTGGTLHLVINNQIGFTTLPKEGRSTRHCSDIAKTFGSPVFHVNGEDPEACVFAAELAVEVRQKFHCDVFLDIVCYRKYGHNEADEPAFTQPLEYQIIRQKRPVREIYRDALVAQGVVEKYMAESLEKEFKDSLNAAMQLAKTPQPQAAPEKKAENNSLFRNVLTGVSLAVLQEVGEEACLLPKDFALHPKLANLLTERKAMLSDQADAKGLDWGMAETLAYGSLLAEGHSIRLSGQDVRRGTFSHRHAVFVDQQKEQTYIPFEHIREKQGSFEVLNSPLSEFGVLGFEYGYSVVDPSSLVIWEAQFGDFCNGAQVIIDQYIASGEQKWGQLSPLTLYLPHGYEGQGPEHSSGRMERFLCLCSCNNMVVANPTTPAQFFHLIRRQVLRPAKKPLIVFTPKALLRFPACISKLSELESGSFREILDDPTPPKKARAIAFCSGKIYYDLIQKREQEKTTDIAIVRIEQLYPLHIERLKEVIGGYPKVEECFWVQEEPSNMGAWDYIRPQLRTLLPEGVELKYAGRPRGAAPAVGSYALHKKQLQNILQTVFGEHKPSIFDVASHHKA